MLNILGHLLPFPQMSGFDQPVARVFVLPGSVGSGTDPAWVGMLQADLS